MSAATTFNGTYQWVASEWISKSESTPKVDVFTLGACFAIIEAVVLAGRDGLRNIWHIGLESNSCQFAANLDDVLACLASLRAKVKALAYSFRYLLSQWVQHMLVRLPDKRATMNKLQMLCYESDPHFQLIPTLNPSRFDTLKEVSIY